MAKRRRDLSYNKSDWPRLFWLFPLLGLFYAGFFALIRRLFGIGPGWIDGLWQGWILGGLLLLAQAVRAIRHRRRQHWDDSADQTPASGG